MPTIASKEGFISQYPKIMCIVLSRWKSNETKIKSAVQYPLHGLLGSLFGSVHHKSNRGKSGHYIAICEHRASNGWISYDDDIVQHAKFVTKNKRKVLADFMRSAAILFYKHNDNDETQEDVHADEDASSSSSTVSSSSSKQGQNKSTNETAQVASIYMHTQNDFSKDLASEKL
jgi:hypothetical protein